RRLWVCAAHPNQTKIIIGRPPRCPPRQRRGGRLTNQKPLPRRGPPLSTQSGASSSLPPISSRGSSTRAYDVPCHVLPRQCGIVPNVYRILNGSPRCVHPKSRCTSTSR